MEKIKDTPICADRSCKDLSHKHSWQRGEIGPEDIYTLLDDIDNEDEDVEALENAMQFWCSTYDKCEGYKHAIRICLEDQYKHHASEQDPIALEKLRDILLGKTVMQFDDK